MTSHEANTDEHVVSTEELVDVFYALDSIQNDTVALETMVSDQRQKAIDEAVPRSDSMEDSFQAKVAIDQAHLRARYRYAINSLAGRESQESFGKAKSKYLEGVPEDSQQEALERVLRYRQAIDYAAHNSGSAAAVTDSRYVAFSTRNPLQSQRDTRLAVAPQYRIVKSTPDPETGKAWVNITDPHAVVRVSPGTEKLGDVIPESERHVATIKVASVEIDEETGDTIARTPNETTSMVGKDGRMHIVERPNSGKLIRIPQDSDSLRLSGEDDVDENGFRRLYLVIPAGRTSIENLIGGGAELERIAASSAAGRVAVQAAGPITENVITTFEDLRGNPAVIPVAKTQ